MRVSRGEGGSGTLASTLPSISESGLENSELSGENDVAALPCPCCAVAPRCAAGPACRKLLDNVSSIHGFCRISPFRLNLLTAGPLRPDEPLCPASLRCRSPAPARSPPGSTTHATPPVRATLRSIELPGVSFIASKSAANAMTIQIVTGRSTPAISRAKRALENTCLWRIPPYFAAVGGGCQGTPAARPANRLDTYRP